MRQQALLSDELKRPHVEGEESGLYVRDSTTIDKRNCDNTPEIIARVKGKQINTLSAAVENQSVINVEEEEISGQRRVLTRNWRK